MPDCKHGLFGKTGNLFDGGEPVNTIRESCYHRINLIHIPSETAKELYFYVQWTGHFVCRPDFFISRQNFDSYLLLYTESGSGRLLYEGREYILNPDSLILLDCKRPHEYFPLTDGWNFRYIHFHGPMAGDYYRHITGLYSGCAAEGMKMLSDVFSQVLECVQHADDPAALSGQIYGILIAMIRAAHRSALDQTDSRIREALTYITAHYSEELDVSTLASAVHLSRCHFSVEFKKQTGYSPYCYLLNYRLSAARRLLYTTDQSVEHIAALCGFSDPTTFIRAFRRETGLTPAACRAASATKPIRGCCI